MTGEREHFVHRIEAFSDVVIGFSLAQLGATLVVPNHAQTLIDDPGWFFGFLWTFGLVCLMWWNHYRIFRVFKPTTVSLVLNFVLLATIVLIVYFAQNFARVHTPADALVAGRLYFGALSASALVSAALFYLNAGLVRGMMVNAVSGIVQGVVVLLSLAAGDRVVELTVMALGVPVAWILGVLAARRVPRATAPA